MLLHLAEDEKFIDVAIKQFENVNPDKNIYFIELLKGESELKFVKTKHFNIIADTVNSSKYIELIAKIETFDAVILHNFSYGYKTEIVNNSPDTVYFHWLSWGFDLYSHHKLSGNLHLPLTNNFINKNLSFKNKMGSFLSLYTPLLFEFANFLRNQKSSSAANLKLIRKKIKSVSTVIPTEYEFIKKHFSHRIKYLPFKYGNIENLVCGQQNDICSDDNILLGNSASFTNNHLDSFEILKKYEFRNFKIYCPLSYGDNKYAKLIEERGSILLGDNFIPLLNFMPLADYNNVLNRCGNVIMNHNRQQAMGNIIIALWKGARVFLNGQNPVFNYLKNLGIIVFKMDEFTNLKNLPDFDLLAKLNRPKLIAIYGNENVIKETSELVNYLMNNNN